MNKIELKNKLKSLDYPESYYSLNGEGNFGLTYDDHIFGQWHVYILDDRGGKFNEKIFNDESAACEFMYEQVSYYAAGRKRDEEIIKKSTPK